MKRRIVTALPSNKDINTCYVCSCDLSSTPHRRRSIFGQYVCNKHGCIIQKRVRLSIRENKSLRHYVDLFGIYLLRFICPTILHIETWYPPNDFHYHSLQEIHFPITRRSKASDHDTYCIKCCRLCNKYKRRAIGRDGYYCNSCGLKDIRCFKICIRLERKLQKYARNDSKLKSLLRKDIILALRI